MKIFSKNGRRDIIFFNNGDIVINPTWKKAIPFQIFSIGNFDNSIILKVIGTKYQIILSNDDKENWMKYEDYINQFNNINQLKF